MPVAASMGPEQLGADSTRHSSSSASEKEGRLVQPVHKKMEAPKAEELNAEEEGWHSCSALRAEAASRMRLVVDKTIPSAQRQPRGWLNCRTRRGSGLRRRMAGCSSSAEGSPGSRNQGCSRRLSRGSVLLDAASNLDAPRPWPSTEDLPERQPASSILRSSSSSLTSGKVGCMIRPAYASFFLPLSASDASLFSSAAWRWAR